LIIGRDLTVATTATVALGALYALAPFQSGIWWIWAFGGLAIVGAIIPWTVRRVKSILTSERPLAEGAIVVGLLFALLVLSFSLSYYTIELHRPSQFSGLHTKIDSLYFVVTTLSTVGYGDIHAAGQFAKVLVTLQIIFNLAFLGFTVKVVTSATRHRMEQTGSGPSHLL
jgi:hypothetical protein